MHWQVLPITIARFITFFNPDTHVPFAATVFADMLFALSGFLNVILFIFTRPNFLPTRERSTPMILESPTTSSYNARRVKGYGFDSEYRPDGARDDWVVSTDGTPYFPRNPRSLAIIV